MVETVIWEMKDIAAVVDIAHASGQIVKVIFENYYLEDKHKVDYARYVERWELTLLKRQRVTPMAVQLLRI